MILNLNITATKIDLILQEFSRLKSIPLGLLVPNIRSTPIDEVARNKRIFAIAFPTLYFTSLANFNAPYI